MTAREDSERDETRTATDDGRARLLSNLGFEGNENSLSDMLDMPSVAFDVLSESHRRAVIRYLLENDAPVSIRDLATYVAAHQRRTSEAAITAGERDEVVTRLIHVHLPKLVAFELIEWIPERGEISLYAGDQSGVRYDESETERRGANELRESDPSER